MSLNTVITQYSDWIVNLLSTITDLNVLDSSSIDVIGYPYCRVEIKNFVQSKLDNRTVKVDLAYTLELVVSVAETTGGVDYNELTLEGLIGTIMEMFNDPANWHASIGGPSNVGILESGGDLVANEGEGETLLKFPMILKLTTTLS